MNLSFQTRLVLFFSVLLVLVQASTGTAVYWLTRANVLDQLGDTLLSDERIFQRLLLERGERIAQETQILVADFGFRGTVTASDPATIASALENLVYRIHGQRGYFITLQGIILADTSERHSGVPFFFPRALVEAENSGRMVFFEALDEKLYEWAVVPVLAPDTVGWVAIASVANKDLVVHLASMAPAQLNITLLERAPDSIRILASSLPQRLQEQMPGAIDPISELVTPGHRQLLRLGRTTFITQFHRVPTSSTQKDLFAVLQIDLDQALQPYALLSQIVMGLLILGLSAYLLGSYLIARRVARPVRALAGATEQVFEGTFEAPRHTHQHDELGLLANTFARAARLSTEFRDLKRQDQQRREMVANISHDLRTPLTSLHGYLQTVHKKADGLPIEERQRYLEVAVRQSEKVGRLAEELFELAKLECGATLVQSEPFCMPDLIQDVLQKFMLIAEQSEVRLSVDLREELPWAMADISLVERVLTNLVDNAIRHTASGGEVKISLALEGARLVVSIADTGAGIAPEYLPKLFDSDSLFSRFRGTHSGGLGLTIVGKILALHGSTVQVESVIGQGTRIWFDLPAHHPSRIQ